MFTALYKKLSALCTALLLVLTFALTACSGDNVAEFQAEGRKLMEEGNPNGAIVFFKNALDKDAKNFDLRFDLAKAYLKAGKIPQAEEELEKCLLQQPSNVELLLAVAQFNTQARKPEKALGYLKDIEKTQKPTAEMLELFALNYRMLNKAAEAEKAYKDALALDAKRTSATLGLLGLYLGSGRAEEALPIIEKTLAEDPKNTDVLRMKAGIALQKNDTATAENVFTQLITLLPKDTTPSYSLATLMLRQGKLKEAEVILETMNKNFKPNHHSNMLAGMIALQKNDAKQASIYFQQSVDAQPSIDGFYRLAIALHQTKNSESALSNLRRILDVMPTHGPSLMLTGQILFEQKRYEEAERELLRYTENNPNNAQAYSLLGNIQNTLGKKAEALAAYGKALEINPKMSQATMARTNILLAQNNETEAVAELEKAMEANTDSVAARVALFNFHMGKKEFDKASAVVEEGLKEAPENALLVTMKAGLLLALKENDKAIELLKQAHALQPKFLPAAQLLLNIYMTSNKTQEALDLCNAFLEHNPENLSFLVTSAVLLDTLQQTEEATARFEKANALHSERALISLVRRALQAKDVAKAEKYLTDKYAAIPTAQMRSMLTTFYVEQDNLPKALDIYNTKELVNSPEGLVGKFRLYMSAKQFTEALQQAEALIKVNAQAPTGYVLKALALEQMKDFDTAFNTLETAYRNLQDTTLLLQLGNLCLRAEQYDKALSYLGTVLVKDANNSEALMGQGLAYLHQKEYAKSIENYEKVLKTAPNDVRILNNLAMAFAEQGTNTVRAVELAAKAFGSAPENEGVIDTYALTLIRDTQLVEALNIIENGLKTHPNSATLHYRHGSALLASGKKAEGVVALQKAVDLGDFLELDIAKQLIQENK